MNWTSKPTEVGYYICRSRSQPISDQIVAVGITGSGTLIDADRGGAPLAEDCLWYGPIEHPADPTKPRWSWTQDTPTKPGWYWYASSGGVRLLKVDAIGNSQLDALFVYEISTPVSHLRGYWIGPIERPSAPIERPAAPIECVKENPIVNSYGSSWGSTTVPMPEVNLSPESVVYPSNKETLERARAMWNRTIPGGPWGIPKPVGALSEEHVSYKFRVVTEKFIAVLDACQFDIDHAGSLAFTDKDDNVIQVFAAGHWQFMEKLKSNVEPSVKVQP